MFLSAIKQAKTKRHETSTSHKLLGICWRLCIYVVYASYPIHDHSEKMFSVFVPKHQRVAKSKLLGHCSVFMLSGLPDHPDLTWWWCFSWAAVIWIQVRFGDRKSQVWGTTLRQKRWFSNQKGILIDILVGTNISHRKALLSRWFSFSPGNIR